MILRQTEYPRENTQRLPHYLFLFAAMLLLWLLLTGSLAAEELAAGLVVAALVTLISGPYLSILDGIIYQPRALISVFIYLMYFFKQLVIANFDMARIVSVPAYQPGDRRDFDRTAIRSRAVAARKQYYSDPGYPVGRPGWQPHSSALDCGPGRCRPATGHPGNSRWF